MSTKLSPTEINAVASKVQEQLKIKKKEELLLLEKKIKASPSFKKMISLTKRIAKLEEKRNDITKMIKTDYPEINYLYNTGIIIFNTEVSKIKDLDVIKREVIIKNISSVNLEALINELVNELSKK